MSLKRKTPRTSRRPRVRRLHSLGWFRKAFELLNRPFVWGALYLALIPSFAGIYTLGADGFYQTSATHEPSFFTNENKAEYSVAEAIAERCNDYSESNHLGRTFGPPVPAGLIASGSDLLFYFYFPGSSSNDVVTQLDIAPQDVVSPRTIGVSYVLRPADPSQSDELAVFQDYTTDAESDAELSFTDDWLYDVASAEVGSLDGLPNQYPRMLYFSVVTVTTLGFGDITPITTPSRVAVACEAFLGVVLIGLFLNAVGRKRRQPAE
jgi:hypothetical protein